MGSLEGRRVLVVGGTSAIGGGIVERLRVEGAEVAFTGRCKDRGSSVALATGSTFVPVDLNDSAAVDATVHRAHAVLGGLDGLVLVAGVLHQARISETSDEAWDAVIDTNLVAPFLVSQACFPLLQETGGAIVAVVSGTAVWAEMELGAYSVSKRALLWMTKMLAVEGASHNVRVNAVCPGDTASGMSSFVNGRGPRDHGAPLVPPAGRYATPSDVAAAVSFLLSDDAKFCTGTSLAVDGGMRAALRASKVRA